MPHPALLNSTGLVLTPLALSDEEGVPLVVPLIQGTWHIGVGGELRWLERQPEPAISGEWWGDPAVASMRLEPQVAFVKPVGTDVVLLGHAHAPHSGATEGQVGVRVGPVQKVVRVVGDRRLVRRIAGTAVTAPRPFERMPLRYERAFGGWDRRHADPDRHRCEPQNPVGVGFHDASLPAPEDAALPNFEDPAHPYTGYGDKLPPVGFGFIAPNWQPRIALGGTYDEAWSKTRKPLLARDFDRRFFNAGSPGLVTPGHLRGDETAVVIGAAPEGRVEFRLPARATPACWVETRARRRVALVPQLDTVLIDMDLRLLTLTWRAHMPARNGLHDVRSIELQIPSAPVHP
ncbi:DUF2169 domain-containing protein [Aquincola sp. S2]|uniref:DUF2169 domain-containing protein n=1 Tax=Pseudaquabacterium terrae TaxID=2732868 RepID=A0ABX2EBE3_9BURK|nr:DUF2169 domain-containing protein [Aquabacterium terrae]NRF66444.1 DUF2169 domain-containing protein [Aquabacterium terrae]